jgi:glucokinase
MSSLIADCGGTFSRFAWLEKGELKPLIKLRNDQFQSFQEIVSHALTLCPQKPLKAALAVSGAHNGEYIKFTNNPLYASRQELLTLGFENVHLMNDFVPLSLSLAKLEDLYLTFFDEILAKNGHRLVVGVGTGIGIGVLLQHKNHFTPLATEGGHVYFSPVSEVEKELVQTLKDPLVYIETFLSGQGFVTLYNSLCMIEGQTRLPDHSPETLVAALPHDAVAQKAARLFWVLLARACDNFALSYLSHGGLYLTGGMCVRLKAYLNPVEFRAVFTQKPQYQELLRKMPIALIGAQDPAFLGLKLFLEEPELF